MPTLTDIPDAETETVIVQKEQEQNISTAVNISRRGSSDSVPLLNSDSCTEMRELRLEQISTITT